MLTTGTIINGPSGATGALIEGGDQVSAVLISGVATVVNYGNIVGVENPGDTGLYYGVRLGGASGSISNLGTNALIENYIGVYATDNDTVTNAGTIASNYAGGRDALVFGGGTNRLIIDPGAMFIGTVSGSGPVTLAPSGNTQVIGTANGIGTTTLELASASGAGTLSGLGVQYVGFAAVTDRFGRELDPQRHQHAGRRRDADQRRHADRHRHAVQQRHHDRQPARPERRRADQPGQRGADRDLCLRRRGRWHRHRRQPGDHRQRHQHRDLPERDRAASPTSGRRR